MSTAPNALVTVDAGTASTALSILGRVGARWRLLGSIAAPAGTDPAALAEVLGRRIIAADPELAATAGLRAGAMSELPHLRARTAEPPRLAVLGASRRSVGLLAGIVDRTGWRGVPASTETHDPREMTELILGSDIAAVAVGTADPPGPDERTALEDLAALVAAAARRRPELRVIVAGPILGHPAWIGASHELPGDPARVTTAPALDPRGRPGGHGLESVLDGLLDDPADARRALRPALATLADVLDRRIELLDVGHAAGARLVAGPGSGSDAPVTTGVISAHGALVPPADGDAAIDAVLAWSTGSQDRHRMADRLHDLRVDPWADPAGDGGRVRMAALRAAIERLAGVAPDLAERPPADLLVVTAGPVRGIPARAVALAVGDTVRRAGVTHLILESAPLLGPIGTIEDPAERRALLADLVGDLLLPLGSLVIAGGASPRPDGRHVGTLHLEVDGTPSDHELAAGELAILEISAGRPATATLDFRVPARLGRRTRRASVRVMGGLAGIVVDLRDVPLRLPERRDQRRSALAAWAGLAWPGDDR